MQHGVHVPWNGDVMRHVVPREPEPLIRKQVRDIRLGTCNQIIQA
jgi:hypothetical protein